MKKVVGLLIVSFLLISCQQKIKTEDIAKINGYWEIEKVVFEDGEEKSYTVNESYDYFEIGKNNSGFRKKVMPQLDGSFIVNDTQESLKIRLGNDKVLLDYDTPYAKWSEELLEITDDKMVFTNSEKREYHYKKATPINILGNGKKTK
ncbi:MAG TPA: hypothetical protein DCS17_10105 [Flavobacterium sp.]|nr:hypothetical protein [Flavobacterium sp.]HAT81686.1 hypothetical protein [Flavobacterium sp.]